MRPFLIICLLFVSFASSAAPIGETRAFSAATEIFRDKKYDLAERSFTEFLTKHPESEFRAEAVLFLAKAKVNQNSHGSAIELLEKELPTAHRFADQYRFWIAEAYFRTGKFQVAADKYAELVTNHLTSPLVLEATYNKALSFSRLGKWQEVIEMLGPGRSFSKLSEGKLNDRFTIMGLLLLSEALFTQNRFKEAEQQLQGLQSRELDSDAKWRQQYLLSRTQLALGNLPGATLTSSNAVALARTSAVQARIVDASIVQADIFEKAGQLGQAIEVYEQNLAATLPVDHRRHALFKVIQLTIAQNKTADAISRLEQFVGQGTNEPALALASFTLGELRLKQAFALSDPSQSTTTGATYTNFINAAVTNFSQVISNFPQTEYVGKAYLNLGWCRWMEGRYGEAQTNFAEAVSKLAPSEEKAIAHFKLGDTLFLNGDLSGAITNYSAIIRDFAGIASVKSTLFDQALYQIVRAGLQSGDVASAGEAMVKILEWYPNTGYADRSVLLVGQGLNRSGNPAEARKLFADFLQRWPGAPLAAEVQLALAQTYVRERQWTNAITILEKWSGAYTNSPLQPQAEFSRALVTFQAGMATNAFTLFTNFIARYPTNPLAALAQNWIGDFYFNRDDFALAEENYQLVTKLNPSLDTACQAKLSAGRAAFYREDFKKASTHFLSIINDLSAPPQFLAEAYFGLGDTIYSEFMTKPEFPAEDFRQAVQAYTKVAKDFSTNALAAVAWGRLGECHLQWANIYKEASAFDLATNAFDQALHSPFADLKTKSLARLGMGKVMEAMGQSLAAKEHYAKLIYVVSGEDFDPKCVKEAALASAKIYESEGKWQQALSDYERLMLLVPATKPAVEKKILQVKQMQSR